ncbi:hypothetical protein OIO90_006435, partial [Microbotryomycetes sp. JL221]
MVNTSDGVYDVLGIGFGPASLALSIALVEQQDLTSAHHESLTFSQLGGLQQALEQLPTVSQPNPTSPKAQNAASPASPSSGEARALRACFIEKYDRFKWHPGMMLDGSVMQIYKNRIGAYTLGQTLAAFLKDLATLRNPRSAYTFLCYLASFTPSRLVSFISRETFTPTRREFSDYLAWAARKVEQDLRTRGGEIGYGEEVISVEAIVDSPSTQVRLLQVTSKLLATGEIKRRMARNIVLSTGGAPRIPSQLKTHDITSSGKVIHSSAFLEAVPPLFEKLCAELPAERPLRVAIIGSGQSAAETFLAARDQLASKLPSTVQHRPKVDLFIRNATLLPADDSASTNEVFDPGMSQAVYGLTPEGRAKMLQAAKATNYSVANPNTLASMYETLYAQQVEDDIAQRDGDTDENLRRDPRLGIRPFTEICGADMNERRSLRLRILNSVTAVESVEEYDVIICGTGYDRQGWKDILFTPPSTAKPDEARQNVSLGDLFAHDSHDLPELTEALSKSTPRSFSRDRRPRTAYPRTRSSSPGASQPDSPLLAARDTDTASGFSSPPTSNASAQSSKIPEFPVAKNYRLQLPSRTQNGLEFQPTVWLQGSCEATHGISDSLL